MPSAVWNACLAGAIAHEAESSAIDKSSQLSGAASTGCGFSSYMGTAFGYGGGINDAAAKAAGPPPGCVSGNGSTPQFASVWGVAPAGYAYLLMICAG